MDLESVNGIPVSSTRETREMILRKHQRASMKTSLRKLHLVIDFSQIMLDPDFLPNTIFMVLGKCIEFVQEFFELNPLSNIALSILKDKKCMLLCPFKNGPSEIIKILTRLREKNRLGEDVYTEEHKDSEGAHTADIPSGRFLVNRYNFYGKHDDCYMGVDERSAPLFCSRSLGTHR
jgi:Ssl1-like